jgi:hypothetical protein
MQTENEPVSESKSIENKSDRCTNKWEVECKVDEDEGKRNRNKIDKRPGRYNVALVVQELEQKAVQSFESKQILVAYCHRIVRGNNVARALIVSNIRFARADGWVDVG